MKNNAYRIYNAKFKPAYICIGNGRKFEHSLNFMSGFRGILEKIALKFFLFKASVSKAQQNAIDDIAKQIKGIEHALFFDTSAYKDTLFIGVLEDKKGKRYFIKYYKKQQNFSPLKTAISRLKKYAQPHFKITSVVFTSGKFIAFELAEKKSNVGNKEIEQLCLEICLREYKKSGHKCFSHGDFCHWNVIRDKNSQLVLIDYEELGSATPFYDYFHLLCKAQILSGHVVVPKAQIKNIAHITKRSEIVVTKWFEEYLKNENKKATLNYKQNPAPEIKNAIKTRQQILDKISKPTKIFCTHQGYELYGSDRMYALLLMAISRQYPNSKLTIDIPKKGSLHNHVQQLLPRARQFTFGRGWVLRKKNFRQGLSAGLSGFFSGLKNAYQDYKNNDIIFINTIVVINYLIVGIIFRKPKILYVHELLQGRLYKIFFGFLITLSRAKCIFVSDACKKSYYLPLSKKVVVHNCLPWEKEPKITTQNKSKKLRLLIIGRIDPNKGQELLLEALAKLKNKDFTLKIVGDVFEGQAAFLDSIKAKAKQLGVYKNIEFHKFQTDVSKFYNWADVVVVPSRNVESFGLIAVESYAHKTPVIVSDIGGLPEVVQHNKTGFVFSANDATKLAQNIEKYITSPSLKTKHGQAGYKLYKEKFSQEVYFKNMANQIDI